MYDQPAIQLFCDEDGIPGFLVTHVEHLVADKAATHTGSYSLFKPLVHKAVEIVQGHHVEAGFGIAKEYRVGAFPEVISILAQ
jgi:hypothetical protein